MPQAYEHVKSGQIIVTFIVRVGRFHLGARRASQFHADKWSDGRKSVIGKNEGCFVVEQS